MKYSIIVSSSSHSRLRLLPPPSPSLLAIVLVCCVFFSFCVVKTHMRHTSRSGVKIVIDFRFINKLFLSVCGKNEKKNKNASLVLYPQRIWQDVSEGSFNRSRSSVQTEGFYLFRETFFLAKLRTLFSG